MIDKYHQIVLYNLEKYSIPYYLKKKLITRFNPTCDSKEEQMKSRRIHKTERERKDAKINLLENIHKKANLVKTRDFEIDYTEIAIYSSIYFQQIYEMFKTALKMDENSSPLVEYYALLQCVKGVFCLEYEMKDEVFFFTHHGLSKKGKYVENRPYMHAKVYDKGVFYSLLLLLAEDNLKGFPNISDYLEKRSVPSFVDVIGSYNPFDAFVGSWMLSNIVRYKPQLWLKLLEGKDDDIIDTVRDFRGESIPRLIENLFRSYDYRSSLPSRYGY